MVWKCKKCGKTNDNDANFCEKCGKPISFFEERKKTFEEKYKDTLGEGRSIEEDVFAAGKAGKEAGLWVGKTAVTAAKGVKHRATHKKEIAKKGLDVAKKGVWDYGIKKGVIGGTVAGIKGVARGAEATWKSKRGTRKYYTRKVSHFLGGTFDWVNGKLRGAGEYGTKSWGRLTGLKIRHEIFSVLLIVLIGAVIAFIGFIWAGAALILYAFYFLLPNEYQIMSQARERHYRAKADKEGRALDEARKILEGGINATNTNKARKALMKSGLSVEDANSTVKDLKEDIRNEEYAEMKGKMKRRKMKQDFAGMEKAERQRKLAKRLEPLREARRKRRDIHRPDIDWEEDEEPESEVEEEETFELLECPYCGETFANTKKLARHIRLRHSRGG